MDNSFDDKDIILRLLSWNLGTNEGKQKKNEDFYGNPLQNQNFTLHLQHQHIKPSSIFILEKYLMSKTLLSKLLVLLKIKHTEFSDKLYFEHPYKYTFYGLDRILSLYNIETNALMLKNKDELEKLDTPFLAEVNNDITIVENISRDEVSFDWYDEKMNVSYDTFKEIASGAVLLVYPNSTTIEPAYYEHLKTIRWDLLERIGIVILALIIFTSISLLQETHNSLFVYSYSIIGVVGVWISYLIIRKTSSFESQIADKICSLLKTSTCNKVIQMPGSKVFNRYGLGEIGFAYFLSLSVSCLSAFSFFEGATIFISLIALIFPIWSLWYQRFVAKSWCALCLAVLGLILLQGGLCVYHSQYITLASTATLRGVALWGMTFVLIAFSVHQIIGWVTKTISATEAKTQLLHIKHNKEVKDFLFSKEKDYKNNEATSRIVFGNLHSEYTVTILSNPYCEPCAKMHTQMQAILDAGGKVQYVFSYFSEEMSDINKLLIATYFQKGKDVAWKVLSEWYHGGKNKGMSFFAETLSTDSSLVVEEFRHHNEWREETKFTSTPTILFNGKTLPSAYSINDIVFIIKNKL